MENELTFTEIEDNDWGSHNNDKKARKESANKRWEDSKKDWEKTTEEPFENSLSGKWVQKGPYLINKSAKLPFATYVGLEVRLVGIDAEGKPVLEKVH